MSVENSQSDGALWAKYDARVDAMSEKELRLALKREARLRAHRQNTNAHPCTEERDRG